MERDMYSFLMQRWNPEPLSNLLFLHFYTKIQEEWRVVTYSPNYINHTISRLLGVLRP
jgi:hypothetical protein